MSLGCNVRMQKVSHIFIFLNQNKSLRPSGSGQARCPIGIIIGAPWPQWNWELTWVQKIEEGIRASHSVSHLYQHPFGIQTGPCSRYWCSQGAWRSLPLVPAVSTLLRASSLKGCNPSHPIEGHSLWVEPRVPQIVNPFPAPPEKICRLISKNLHHSRGHPERSRKNHHILIILYNMQIFPLLYLINSFNNSVKYSNYLMMRTISRWRIIESKCTFIFKSGSQARFMGSGDQLASSLFSLA